jgi:hypothetical protein
MRFHLAIARAARIDLLTAFYESVLSLLGGPLVRAAYVEEGHNEMLRLTLEVHGGIADALRDQDHVALEKLLALHRKDLVRASNPDPVAVGRPDPRVRSTGSTSGPLRRSRIPELPMLDEDPQYPAGLA